MAVEALTEEVALNLEEAAQITRRLNPRTIGFVLGGVGVGVAIGFVIGYRWNKEKIRAEAFKQSEKEVDQIREHYRQKTVVAEPKPSTAELLEERGYSVGADVAERPLKAPVPVHDHPHTAYQAPVEEPEVLVWDYPREMALRSKQQPYVIHQDEFNEADNGYNQVVYTYYAEDDVLTGEDSQPLPHADLVVGQDNLKFGYGTDDNDVVYVRNDRLEIEMEICRLNSSYERDVLGHDTDEPTES